MMTPEISVVVPVFNTPLESLEKCLRSLTNQTFDNIEILIIDDGSREEIANEIDKLCKSDERLKTYHKPNGGLSSARNYGIKKAEGIYICFIDSDDYVAPWMLEDLYSAIVSSEDVDSVLSFLKVTEEDDYSFERHENCCAPAPLEELEKTALIGMAAGGSEFLSCGACSILVRKEQIKNLLFNEDIKYMEDVIWNLQRLQKSKSVLVLNEILYAYKMNPYSMTHEYKTSIIDYRKEALKEIAKWTRKENKSALGLRVLANYYLCCKCVMWEKNKKSFRVRLKEMKELNNDPIWDMFKSKGVSVGWKPKEKIKRWLAISGLLPYFMKLKGE